MQDDLVSELVWLLVIVVVVVLFVRMRRSRGRVGPAAIGSVYNWLNEDKQKAVEIIVEERAGQRDPEDKDGNLPELEDPSGRRHS